MTDHKIDFQDLLQEVVLEGDSSYAALKRWTERFPDYRDRLADFFATWSIQKVRSEMPDPVQIDTEAIVQKAVAHALNIVQREGRVVEPVVLASVSLTEQMVLAAIHSLHGEGYNVKIMDTVTVVTGRRILLGSTLEALNNLEERGLVVGRRVDAKDDPSGKTRTYYTVTLVGEEVLELVRQAAKEAPGFLGEHA